MSYNLFPDLTKLSIARCQRSSGFRPWCWGVLEAGPECGSWSLWLLWISRKRNLSKYF